MTKRTWIRVSVAAGLGVMWPLGTAVLHAQAQTPQLPAQAYQESFKALFLLFVLAVVLESALAVLFNWRPFVERFNARAVRPLISFVVAYVFVDRFSLDLVTGLVNATTASSYMAAIRCRPIPKSPSNSRVPTRPNSRSW